MAGSDRAGPAGPCSCPERAKSDPATYIRRSSTLAPPQKPQPQQVDVQANGRELLALSRAPGLMFLAAGLLPQCLKAGPGLSSWLNRAGLGRARPGPALRKLLARPDRAGPAGPGWAWRVPWRAGSGPAPLHASPPGPSAASKAPAATTRCPSQKKRRQLPQLRARASHSGPAK